MYSFLFDNEFCKSLRIIMPFDPLACGISKGFPIMVVTKYRGQGQYHGCRWPGSLHHQVISSDGINCIRRVDPWLPWEGFRLCHFSHCDGKVIRRKDVRMTTVIFTRYIEDKLQFPQRMPRLSTWLFFHFCGVEEWYKMQMHVSAPYFQYVKF